MSSDQDNPYRSPPTGEASAPRPTNVRWIVLGATTLTSFMLYLDRVCMAMILADETFKRDVPLTAEQDTAIKGWFFGAYALCQVPAGWLADRFGARGMMTFYVVMWSAFTLLGGFSTAFLAIFAARVGLAVMQAGAYPTSVGLLGHWIPFNMRGVSSAVVATGGRIGGTLAPLLTGKIMGAWGWRPALWIYGIAGMVVGALFWKVFRTSPDHHPRCNRAERDLIVEGRPASEAAARRMRTPMPWGPLLSSFGMWLNCLVQFCTNVGWAFIVSDMPRYLRDVHQLDRDQAGFLTTIAFSCGIPGMLCGGWLTDFATRKLGVRWGRGLPMFGARLISTLAYVVCLWLDNPYAVTAAVGLMSFSTDLGVGAVWAYIQDVGGRYSSAILGWGNMWGNFGALLQPYLVTWLLAAHGSDRGWTWVFAAFATAFAVSSVAALGMDGTKPIVPKTAAA